MPTQADVRHKYAPNKAEVFVFLRDAYGINPTQCIGIKAGVINTSLKIYSGDRTYLLRIYRQGRSRRQIARELAFNQAIAKEEIPTALALPGLNHKEIQVLRAKNGQAYFVVLFPFLGGHHTSPRQYGLIPAIAKIQAMMHRTGLRATREKHTQFIKGIMTWLDNEYAVAEKKLLQKSDLRQSLAQAYTELKGDYRKSKKTVTELPYALCHMDYDSDNILNDGTSVTGVIDFDDLAVVPPVLDLGFSLWWWIYHNSNRRRSVFDAYITSYEKGRPLTDSERALLPLFMRLRNLILVCLLFVNTPVKVKVPSLRRGFTLEQWLRSM